MKMRVILFSVFVLILLFFCGCGKKKTAATPVWRTDIDSIEERVPLLEPIESCVWQTALTTNYSSRGIPAPEEYYIRGFIQISENVKAQILESYEWQDVEIDVNGLNKPPFVSMYEEFIKVEEFKKSEDFMQEHTKKSPCSVGEIILNPKTNTVYFDLSSM